MADFQYNESQSTGSSGSSGSSVSRGGTSSWYDPYARDLFMRGRQASMTPWQVFGGQRVADFVGDQTDAFGNLRNQMGDWQPNMQQANVATGTALTGMQGLQQSPYTQGALSAYGRAVGQSQFNPNTQQQFMNPYIQNVTNEIARLGNQNFKDVTMNTLNSNFTDAGQFGSARQMAMASDAAARNQREISGAQGNALFQAQNQAAQQYGDWANRGIGAQQAMAQGQMGVNQFLQGLNTATGQLGNQYAQLGQLGQQMGFGDVNALLGIGNQQQALDQKRLDAQQAQFQEGQMAPWQPLQNLSNLFKTTPIPQYSMSGSSNTSGSTNTSNNWGTAFKRGGLVQLAGGGLPEDEEDLDLYGEPSIPSGNNDLVRRILNLRTGLLGTAINSPSLQPLPERGFMDMAGEAMMRAAAQGPANWGQAIGKAGSSYYDIADQRGKENQAREIARLKLAESAIPDLGRGAMGLGGVGGTEKLTQARGKDGSLWQVSSTDRGYARLIQPGNYASDIARLAANAADKDLEGATGLSTEDKKIERQRLINEYSGRLSQQYAGLGGVPTAALGGPGGGTAPASGGAPKTGGGAGMPTGSFDLSGGVDAVRRDIAKIGDPGERQAALGALERQIAEGRGGVPGGLKVPTPEEKNEQEKVGAKMGDRFMEIQKSGEESDQRMNMINSMANMLVGVQTGKLTPLGTEIGAWAQSTNRALGNLVGYKPINIDENLGNKEAFRALSNQFALQLRNPAGGAGMPGALSEGDRKFLESMSPSLAMSPEGVQKMLETYTKLEQRSKDVARIAREYRQNNPRGTFDQKFYDELHKYSAANPLFELPKNERREHPPGKKLRPGHVVNGYEYVGPAGGDGNNPNNWRQVK